MKYECRSGFSVVAVVVLASLSCSNAIRAEDADLSTKAAVRRPVALATIGRGRVVSANRRSGTLSVIDAAKTQVISEHGVCRSLADAVAVPGHSAVFVLDDDQHQLLLCKFNDGRCAPSGVAEVPSGPVQLCVSSKPRRVYVTSLWPQQVTVVDFDESWSNATGLKHIDLPFPPRNLTLVSDREILIVAHAFSGRLAIINTKTNAIDAIRSVPGHNIRGLAIDVDRSKLLISHQKLNPLARADFDDVHWGSLVTNAVRVVDIETFLTNDKSPLNGGWLERLGRVGNATADPGPVLVDDRGRQAVALQGVGDVSITRSSFANRFHVGRRPSALLSLNDQLFVADEFSDSVSVIDLVQGTQLAAVSLGPTRERTAVDRGELLFFNARISHDGWMSCHSCHTDGHTNGLLADTLGDGDYGAPKRIPSLLGVKSTGPWAWNGSMKSLADQVRKSTKTTMHGADLSEEQASDLVAYLESLRRPVIDRELNADLIARGRGIFERKKCVRCHRPPAYTIDGTFDVGLIDEQNRRRFNPPSLRGVGSRPRLFHDGRAHGLRAVIEDVRHQLDEPLSRDDVDALVEFLRSL